MDRRPADYSATTGPEAGVDRRPADYSATTGPANRWANLYGGEGRTVDFDQAHHLGYPDMAPNDARGLTWTTPELDEDRELVGHPSVHLWVEADVEGRVGDGAEVDFFAYLEEVDPDGFSRYLSEGCLRLSRRATADPPYNYLGLPWHPCGAGDVSATDGQAQAEAVVQRTLDELGSLDILFNNAGATTGVGRFVDQTDEQWELSWQVNVMGSRRMSLLALAPMSPPVGA